MSVSTCEMSVCVFSDEELFCKVTRELLAGEKLLAFLLPPPGLSSSPHSQLSPPLSLVTQKQPVVKEEPLYPAALHSDIQLLPQQAGMAAILATAVVNSKSCGFSMKIHFQFVSNSVIILFVQKIFNSGFPPPSQDMYVRTGGLLGDS